MHAGLQNARPEQNSQGIGARSFSKQLWQWDPKKSGNKQATIGFSTSKVSPVLILSLAAMKRPLSKESASFTKLEALSRFSFSPLARVGFLGWHLALGTIFSISPFVKLTLSVDP